MTNKMIVKIDLYDDGNSTIKNTIQFESLSYNCDKDNKKIIFNIPRSDFNKYDALCDMCLSRDQVVNINVADGDKGREPLNNIIIKPIRRQFENSHHSATIKYKTKNFIISD